MDERSACPQAPTEPRCHPEGGTLLLPCYFKQRVYNNGWERKQRGRSSVGTAWVGGAAGAPPGELGDPSCQAWDLSQPPLCFILQQLTPLGACLNLFLFYFAFWPRDWLKVFLKEREVKERKWRYFWCNFEYCGPKSYGMGPSGLWFAVIRRSSGFQGLLGLEKVPEVG